MRNIDAGLKARFQSAQQTRANNADPHAVIWLHRPTVPLSAAEFLERDIVDTTEGLKACSIAVRRPRADREADFIYVACVDKTGAHVKKSPVQPKLGDSVWTGAGFSAPNATDIAIAFDGTMPKKADGTAQFVTEREPWVFWIEGGALKARKLGLLGGVTLAAANCGAVSAVRATWDSAASVDFGLVVFFLLGGALYYRQLIGGEWMDAEPVSFGPAGVTWTDINAFRTWDYRVGVQGLASDGKVYELFTTFQGIGRHSGEHVIFDAASTAPYGGLYRTGQPNIVEAANESDGLGNYGKIATFEFDRHLQAAEVAAQPSAFRIVDSLGRQFAPLSATLAADGMTVKLRFLDFNSAVGTCRAVYIPGTVHSMAGATLTAKEKSWKPHNLVAPGVPAPTPIDVSNGGDTVIFVSFSLAVTGELADAAAHFTARLSVPDCVPDGTLHEETRTPVSAVWSGSDTLALAFSIGNLTALNNAVGQITLIYDGGAIIYGAGGPVSPFELAFLPTGLTPKYNPNDAEHIEISAAASGTLTEITTRSGREAEHIELAAVTVAGALTRIYQTPAKTDEHIEISGVAASGTLTHIDDL